MIEQWKTIPDFPDYEVSNTGLVRSHKRKIPHILKPGRHPGGYRRIGLRRNGNTHIFTIGHLVLLAFRGPCPEGCEMCHDDGNPANDHLDNLRWDTHTANMQDAARCGKVGRPRIHKPHVITEKEILANRVKVMRAKMTDSISLGQRIKVLRALRNLNQRELAERIGIHQASLSNIENDHVIPSPKSMLAIMTELGWSEQLEIAFEILTRDQTI